MGSDGSFSNSCKSTESICAAFGCDERARRHVSRFEDSLICSMTVGSPAIKTALSLGCVAGIFGDDIIEREWRGEILEVEIEDLIEVVKSAEEKGQKRVRCRSAGETKRRCPVALCCEGVLCEGKTIASHFFTQEYIKNGRSASEHCNQPQVSNVRITADFVLLSAFAA